MKPANIFFSTDKKTLKIGDFGLATCFTSSKQLIKQDTSSGYSMDVFAMYMSPELKMRKAYDRKVDVYALGIILFELLYPFDTAMEKDRILKKLKNLEFPSSFTHKKEKSVIQTMLSKDPKMRPEIRSVSLTLFPKKKRRSKSRVSIPSRSPIMNIENVLVPRFPQILLNY